jgi:hypothetical protein
VPPASAIKKFQVLYEKHYGITLSESEAEIKLRAFLGLLSVARECADASGAAQKRDEAAQGAPPVSSRSSSKYDDDQLAI